MCSSALTAESGIITGGTKQQVIEFVVELEVNIKGKWKSVIRYDTVHGFAHRDIYHADGRTEKTPLPVSDYNSALTFAE